MVGTRYMQNDRIRRRVTKPCSYGWSCTQQMFINRYYFEITGVPIPRYFSNERPNVLMWLYDVSCPEIR